MESLTKILRLAWLSIFFGIATASVVGCEQEGPFEEAGEEADEALEEAEDAVDEAADEVEDEL